MKKVVYETFGNPLEVLKLVEADPVPLAAGQARVQVLRAPVNPSDLIQISGNYGVRPSLPAVPGNEGIGRVVEVAGKGIEVGQLVMLPSGTGTWTTETVSDLSVLVPLPEGDLDQLSMLRINPATAHVLLSDFVTLSRGDWVIQSAANSAVGVYLNQLAMPLGINVLNVVRRESAIAGLREIGARHVLVDGPDLAKRMQAVSGARMKLAIDAVAGETFSRLGATLETGGTLVSYGVMSNKPCSVDAEAMIFRDLRLRGFWLVKWYQSTTAEHRKSVYSDLTQAILAGTLHAPVARHFSLEEIAEAARYSWAGERTGKVILAPNGV